jgi:hypothetical protein
VSYDAADYHGRAAAPPDSAAARWAGYRVVVEQPAYFILERDGQLSIQHRRCQMISHNPHDVEQRYCGNCKVFLEPS